MSAYKITKVTTRNYYKGDLKKTNEVMGGWYIGEGVPSKPSFRVSFLTDQVDRDDLISLQEQKKENGSDN